MKKKLVAIVCLCGLVLPLLAQSLLPTPARMRGGKGVFVVGKNIRVQGNGGYADRLSVSLSDALKACMTDEPASGTVLLELNELAGLSDEAYTLVVTPEEVKLRASSPSGLFYAKEAFVQLARMGKGRVQACRIEDAPRYGWRGFMLDESRHFFGKEKVKQYLDIMASLRMNVFHWHLTDDQGWRIEIRHYPELTKVGSRRAETVLGRNTNIYDGIPSGGYYTQRQIRDVVAYAAERFITVIPEIEMPGHASAALAAYPWLGCAGEGYIVRTRWGVFPEVYCAGKDSTFEFMENVLAEVCELFPSEYIHIGGDECPKQSWTSCPACQQRIRNERLEHENELQSYFVHRIEKWLNARGRNLIGWDEILEGGISKTATIMSWRGADGGVAAAKAGNQVIMTPNTHCYLDYFQTQEPERLEPLGIGGYVPVRKVYSFDPYDRLSSAEQSCIQGVQGNIWTEYIASFAHAQHMALPRLAALAEVGWACDRRDFGDFTRRMTVFRKLYDKCGYRYASYFFDGTGE